MEKEEAEAVKQKDFEKAKVVQEVQQLIEPLKTNFSRHAAVEVRPENRH